MVAQECFVLFFRTSFQADAGILFGSWAVDGRQGREGSLVSLFDEAGIKGKDSSGIAFFHDMFQILFRFKVEVEVGDDQDIALELKISLMLENGRGDKKQFDFAHFVQFKYLNFVFLGLG